jgi:hypothetical protein
MRTPHGLKTKGLEAKETYVTGNDLTQEQLAPVD